MGLELGALGKINLRTPPKPVQITVIVIPIIIVLAITVYVVLQKKEVMDKLKVEITKLDQDIAKKEAMVARLPELKRKYRLMQQELCELEKVVPAEYEVSSFLKQVNNHALERGLTVVSWKEKPQRPYPKGIVNEMPISLVLEGGYHSLGQFMADLTTLDRVVTVSNLSITAPKKDKGVVNLSFGIEAVAYTSIKPADCSGLADEGAKK